jgi:hypothetical protein
MPGITDVATEFGRFAQSLRRRVGLVDCIGSLNNGFEGWVKIEFFFWLLTKRKLRAAKQEAGSDVWLEYKVRLDRRHRGVSREVKHCDLWIRDQTESGFHYVELKAPFDNGNRNKVLASAAYDLWHMSRLRSSYEKAVSGNAIVLGVGFSPNSWKKGLELVRKEAGLEDDVDVLLKDGKLDDEGLVRFSVFTWRY